MKFSQREYSLVIITAAAALFGVTILLARPKVEEWKKLRIEQGKLMIEIEKYKELVGNKDLWLNKFEELSKMLPQHPADKKVDVYWLSIMDNLAVTHGVTISKRSAGEERRMGDVYELPIEAKEWEANLDAIVHFLFDLQSKGAMLDIRQLLIKPKGNGVLRGRFILLCAYTREKAQ